MTSAQRLWSTVLLAVVFAAPGVVFWCVFHAFGVFLGDDWSIKLGPGPWETFLFWLAFAPILGCVLVIALGLRFRYLSRRRSAMGEGAVRVALLISGIAAGLLVDILSWQVYSKGYLLRLTHDFGPLVLVVPVVISALVVPFGFLVVRSRQARRKLPLETVGEHAEDDFIELDNDLI